MIDAAKLLEAGPLGVVVILVIYFLWYLEKRDKSYQESIQRRDTQWQEFTKAQRAEDNSVIKDLMQQVKDLAAQLVALRDDFNEHNTWERARLEELTAKPNMDKPTTPRRGRAQP